MDVSGIFSDDQMAVIGCFLAIAVCGFIAALSFQFGPAGRQQKQIEATRSRTISVGRPQNDSQHQDRRAA